MKDDPTLESLLRSLRPAPLPLDLREQLKTPRPLRPSLRRYLYACAAAAAAIILCCLLWPHSPTEPSADPAPICIHHKESTLVQSRDIGTIERDGRLWQVKAQEWRDEELTLCSNTPLTVRFSLTRHEIIYSPVTFY